MSLLPFNQFQSFLRGFTNFFVYVVRRTFEPTITDWTVMQPGVGNFGIRCKWEDEPPVPRVRQRGVKPVHLLNGVDFPSVFEP